MATTYDELNKKADDTIAKYKKDQQQRADEQISNLNASYDQQNAAAKQNYDKQIATADTQYRGLYDANAVQELIDRNTISERMANLGLSKSGLNATQQTAIALSRGNRDADITRQKQEYMDTVLQGYNDMLAQNEANRAAEQRAIQQGVEDRAAQYAVSVHTGLGDWAKADYDREVALEKEKNAQALELAKLEQERLIKQAQLEEEARKRETEMLWEAFLSDREYGDTTGSGYSYTQSLLGGGSQQDAKEAQTAGALNTAVPFSQQTFKKVNDTWNGFLNLGSLLNKISGGADDTTKLGNVDWNDEVSVGGEVMTLSQVEEKLLEEGLSKKEARQLLLELTNLGDAETYSASAKANTSTSKTSSDIQKKVNNLTSKMQNEEISEEDMLETIIDDLYPGDEEKQRQALGYAGYSATQIENIIAAAR